MPEAPVLPMPPPHKPRAWLNARYRHGVLDALLALGEPNGTCTRELTYIGLGVSASSDTFEHAKARCWRRWDAMSAEEQNHVLRVVVMGARARGIL